MNTSNNTSKPSSNQSDKVKLVFDVMPQGASSNEILPEAKDMDLNPTPAPMPQMPEQLVSPPPNPSMPQAQPAPAKTGKRLQLPVFNWRLIAIILLAVAVLGASGYFAYSYFFNSKSEVLKEPATGLRPGEAMDAKMSDSWLIKHFEKADCDPSICGTSKDPDSDGLSNSQEQEFSTDPNLPDSDYDGLADSDEVNIYNTDPKVMDTDGDGFEDGSEVRKGYSPAMGGSQKISVVESQVISDNTEKYGLHEPTKTYLTLSDYKVAFESGPTSTVDFALSLPKDWAIEVKDGAQVYKSEDPNKFIYLGRFAPANATEADLQMIVNSTVNASSAIVQVTHKSQQKIGLVTFNLDESLQTSDVSGQESKKVLRAIFLKNSKVYQVYFSLPESQWADNRTLARTVVNSIR